MNITKMRERHAALRNELDPLRESISQRVADDIEDDKVDELRSDMDRFDDLQREFEALENDIATWERFETVKPEPVRDDKPTFHINTRTDDDPLDMRDLSFSTSVSDVRARVQHAIEHDKTAWCEDFQREQMSVALSRVDNERGDLARHMATHATPLYASAWRKMVSDRAYELTGPEQEALRAARAHSLTAGEGGYTVPTTIDPTLVLSDDGSISFMRQIGTVRQTLTNTYEKNSIGTPTASYDAEGTETTDDATAVGNTEISIEKAQVFIPFSIEIGMDWPGFQADMLMVLQDAKANLENTAFVTGSGADSPQGIVTALDAQTTTEVAMTTNGEFAVVDVYKAIQAVPPRFRTAASCNWIMSFEYLNRIRQFATANNYHAFTVDLTAEGIPAILGKRVYEASAMTGALTNSAIQNAIVVGDTSAYYIVDRVGFNLELVPHVTGTTANYPNGQRAWYGWWRNGADVVNNNALRLLQNGSN